MSYQLRILKSARKYFLKQDQPTQKRLAAQLAVLQDDPRPPDAIELTNRDREWRVRVGSYRIIYRIDDGELIVVVITIAPRGEAYKS